MASSLTVSQLKDSLSSLGLKTNGKRDQLKERLKKAVKKKGEDKEKIRRFFIDEQDDQRDSELESELEGKEQLTLKDKKTAGNGAPTANGKSGWRPKYHTFLITDVEATCEEGRNRNGTKSASRVSFDYPNESESASSIEFVLFDFTFYQSLRLSSFPSFSAILESH